MQSTVKTMSVQGTILVLDGVSTNRIMLKVQLTAAWYHVVQGEKLAGLGALLRRTRPDLVLTAQTLPDGDAADVKRLMLSVPALQDVPVVAIAPQNDRAARLRNLSEGLDDVLAYPFKDTLLLARVRSLLRARAETQDLKNSGNPQSVGFAEAPAAMIAPKRQGQIAVLAHTARTRTLWHKALNGRTQHSVCSHTLPNLSGVLSGNIPDAIVVELNSDPSGLNMLADLKSRTGTRRTALIGIIPDDNATLAAEALDRGADAICLGGFCPDEVSLRVEALIARKAHDEQMRDSLRRGLEESWIDTLTGLNNRRFAQTAMDQLLHSSVQKQRGFAIMLADLDHFKSINDRYGHSAGDRVLVEAGKRMKRAFGPDGFLARIGGEEFLFGLPNATREKALRKAANICSGVSSVPVVLPDIPARLPVTVSIGLKVCEPPFSPPPDGSLSAESLIKCADKALYAAKQAGRNQVWMKQNAA